MILSPQRYTLFPYTTLFRSKGKKFKNIQDVADPLTVAINYENQGADALFVLDISGKERNEFLTIIQELTSELTIRFLDRKSTRLNSSHVAISYAVFCLTKKK